MGRARAGRNAEVDARVRLADPNGQKADKIAVHLGRPVGVAPRKPNTTKEPPWLCQNHIF